MPKPAPSLGRLTLVFLCLAGLAGLFFLMRCQKADVPVAKSAVAGAKTEKAHLVMVNRSPCEWQISISPVSAGERQVWRLSVDQTRMIELGDGSYLVEQTMLTDDAGPDATRRFSMYLDAGQIYRWQLVTLLSEAAEENRRPAQGKAGHE